MYLDYLAKEIKKSLPEPSNSDLKYIRRFKDNLVDGIEYYKGLIPQLLKESEQYRAQMKDDLLKLKAEFDTLIQNHSVFFMNSAETVLS